MYDNHDGSYTLAYNLPVEGLWVLHPAIGSAPVKQHGLLIQSEYGALQAQDITFVIQHAADAPICGALCSMQIQVHLGHCIISCADVSCNR